MLSVGSITARPCKCRARQKAIRTWLVVALTATIVGIGIAWALLA